MISSDLLHCTFRDTEFYWSLFNTALVYHCAFENCTFLGASFPGSYFVRCSFKNCQFKPNNLGRDCSFEGSQWFDCEQSGCTGLTVV